MNIQESIKSRHNLLQESSIRLRYGLPVRIIEEWHNYCQDDEDLSDVVEEEGYEDLRD